MAQEICQSWMFVLIFTWEFSSWAGLELMSPLECDTPWREKGPREGNCSSSGCFGRNPTSISSQKLNWCPSASS